MQEGPIKPKSPEPLVVQIRHKDEEMGGSRWKEFNHVLLKQVMGSLWMAHAGSKDGQLELYDAAAAALAGIRPKDEVEGMLAAQMVAAHSATMECYRRAMLKEQTFEGRHESLKQANRLSRTYTMQMDALSRHRGKGQQRITVEHVHVHAGGQAVVGAVEAGGGVASKNQRQPHAQALALTHAPVAPLWGQSPEREPVPLAGDAERPMQNARGKVAWRVDRRGIRTPVLG
jgi:hypothetical protein